MSDPGVCGEAERRLTELLAVLEARELDVPALEAAGERVAEALARLTRLAAPSDLARVIDLHACVRQTAALRAAAAGQALERTQADRSRHAHLTRPSDTAGGLDVRA